MKAKPGDRIIIAPPRIETPVREGEIVETRGPDGSPPFLVRWSDGHEALIFPGPGSGMRVQGSEDSAAGTGASATATATAALPATQTSGQAPPRVHDWQVRISIFERDDETDAHVVLLSDTPGHLTAHGHSHRSSTDRGVPEIGDEVAVARALRVLADQLLDTAAGDIEEMTGEHDVTLRSR
jgi:hypothetical protein